MVIFYDSRDFPNNDGANTYIAVSFDEGATWDDGKISDYSWSAVGLYDFYSDYSYSGKHLAVDCNFCSVIPVWSDNHTGSMLAYSQSFNLDCPYDLALCDANIFDKAMYSVTHDIYVDGNYCSSGSSYLVSSGGKLVMQAGNQILLEPGFHASNGCYYHAYISPNCSTFCSKIDEFQGPYDCNVSDLIGPIAIKGEELFLNNQGELLSNVMIYPNPASSNAIFSYRLSRDSYVSISIYSIMGNLVSVLASSNQRAGLKRLALKVEDFAQGNYLLVISSGSETKTQILTFIK